MKISLWISLAGYLTTLWPVSASSLNLQYVKALGWTIGNSETLKAEIPNVAAATELVRAIKGSAEPASTVGDYLFAQPFGTGETALFVTIDYTGRGFFARLAVIRKIGSKLVYTEINDKSAINIESLALRVVDLDQDGVSEVLVPHPLEARSAVRPTPFFIDIYSWNGTAYKLNNGNFKNYYRDVVLPETENNLAQSKQKAGGDELEAAMQWKYQTEVDAINSFLGSASSPRR